MVNGVDLLSVKDNGRSFLSSSLEAEQRLLRQMGWNETEEDEYVITEDDKKEFQKLTNQVSLKVITLRTLALWLCFLNSSLLSLALKENVNFDLSTVYAC